jgi:PadR family transcriptional regulator PadR
MTQTRTNPPFTNGVPEMLLLRLLARQPMYGYQLVQAIKTSSRDVLEFGEGCIYPILHRLEKDGLLSGERQSVAGRSRVVYQLTAKGRRHLQGTIGHWERIVAAVSQVLAENSAGEGNGQPELAA